MRTDIPSLRFASPLSLPLPLPLVAEPGRRIYSLVLRRPLHHGHILLLGFFLGEDQFCFSMHFISLVHRRKQRLPFIETLPRQKHAIQSSLHHFGAISPPPDSSLILKGRVKDWCGLAN